MESVKKAPSRYSKEKQTQIFNDYLEDFAIYQEEIREKERDLLLDWIQHAIKNRQVIIENSH